MECRTTKRVHDGIEGEKAGPPDTNVPIETHHANKKARCVESPKKTHKKSNFYLDFLNLPEAMEMFGPMRDLCEGSVKGEGWLPKLKQNLKETEYGRGHWIDKVLEQERVFGYSDSSRGNGDILADEMPSLVPRD